MEVSGQLHEPAVPVDNRDLNNDASGNTAKYDTHKINFPVNETRGSQMVSVSKHKPLPYLPE
jgi:hypothetical protein